MHEIMAALTVLTDLKLFLLVGLGTFAGVYIGAIPGLSVTMAVSIGWPAAAHAFIPPFRIAMSVSPADFNVQ